MNFSFNMSIPNIDRIYDMALSNQIRSWLLCIDLHPTPDIFFTVQSNLQHVILRHHSQQMIQKKGLIVVHIHAMISLDQIFLLRFHLSTVGR